MNERSKTGWKTDPRLRQTRTIVLNSGTPEAKRAEIRDYFHATYKIDASAVTVDGKHQISGQRDLGRIFGGTYTHTGEAADDAISATYKCRIDHGTFELSKLK